MAATRKLALALILMVALFAQIGFCADQPTQFTVTFISLDGQVLPGERVVFAHDGNETAAYTDAAGRAVLELVKSGMVNATINKNGYDYSFSFQVDADGTPKSESAAIYPLLKIKYFKSTPDTDNCYILQAAVSDPRTNRPITVRMLKLQNGGEATDLQVGLDENNVAYTARICAGADTYVKMVASNKYETAESVILLSYAAPLPEPVKNTTQPNVTNGSVLPPPIRPPSPTEGYEVVIVAVALIATLLAAAVIMLGRTNQKVAGGTMGYVARGVSIVLGSAVRPIIEYLRSIRLGGPKKQ